MCVPHFFSVAGKYLLFYLLERRLLDDTLHRLLLDGLKWEILQEGKRISPERSSAHAHVEEGLGRCREEEEEEGGVPSSPVTLVRIWPPAT